MLCFIYVRLVQYKVHVHDKNYNLTIVSTTAS
jgi:hypothetical protein